LAISDTSFADKAPPALVVAPPESVDLTPLVASILLISVFRSCISLSSFSTIKRDHFDTAAYQSFQ